MGKFETWAPVFMDRLVADFKMSEMDAAAIVGNAGHESAGFETLQEIKPVVKGSRGGYGIMQWTGPRRRAYEAYCKKNGMVLSDMDSNYSFLREELKGPEGAVLPKLKKAKTLNDKVKVFCDGFLRPGVPHYQSRNQWAARALKLDRKVVVADPERLEKPVAKTKTFWSWIATMGLAPVATFAGFDWKVQLFLIALIVGLGIYAIKRRADIGKVVRELREELS